MSIFKKLKSFFTKDNEQVELELHSAEIREGRAYLHPKDNKDITYLVRSDNIEIYLSKNRALTDGDVEIIENLHETFEAPTPEPEPAMRPEIPLPEMLPIMPPLSPMPELEFIPVEPIRPREEYHYDYSRYKKRMFSVSLYPEEYSALMTNIKEYGYNRADFILACASTATKGTMAKAHKRIVKEHNALRKEQRELKKSQSIM